MNTLNFQNLIQKITSRQLIIDTQDNEIMLDKEYFVYKHLPLTDRKIYFKWKVAKTEEKVLKSFITAFTTKYKEPSPKAYDYAGRVYGEKALWINKTEMGKEQAYWHHSSNMYSKNDLREQIEANFNDSSITETLTKYGFYNTDYGIGIFILFNTNFVVDAVNKLSNYLKNQNIPFANEYSEARWVYRFKLGLSKEQHKSLLLKFSNTY